jgi:hypothetical protein
MTRSTPMLTTLDGSGNWLDRRPIWSLQNP